MNVFSRRFGAALALGAALSLGAIGAAAQNDDNRSDDALLRLFQDARDGSGDPHLPYILNDLKKALSTQNLLDFLKLVEPEYFTEQFALVHTAERSPGESLGQFSCEFFSVCDISKHYGFSDIVSGHVLEVKAEDGLSGGLVAVRLELRMWDGLTLESEIFYDPQSARLLAARG